MPTAERKCSICGGTKPLTEFPRSYKKDRTPDMASYYVYRCKECIKKRERNRIRNRTEYFKERDQSPQKKHYVKERTKKLSAEGYYKEKWVNTPTEERRAVAEKAKYRKYGLSKKKFDEMLKAQNGSCAICGRIPNGRERALAIDHDHDTGQVRGLLCGKCNLGLGYFQDDVSLLKKAHTYLKKFK